MADAGLYVVVTIADNGVVHAWGTGPVVDTKGDQVLPFIDRTEARREAARFRREERKRLEQPGETGTTQVKVCKILGVDPVPVD
ncbi:hypothetical protein [Longimicrobium sp.]|jgi:hypothetical protein|uniref:hypothetical protein n=1 Tax=Longimicrobium sp. TaxID=2029185 RepID=UPI002ED775D2